MTPKGMRHYRPEPIDFLLLERMPEQGTIGGVHWKGRRVADLAAELNEFLEDAQIATSTVQARLRSMQSAALVQSFGGGPRRVWAVTPEGMKFKATKDKVLGS